MKDFFIYSLLIGIFSFTYTYILTQPHQILNTPYKFLHALFKTDERKEQGKGVYWLFMIIMYCEKCNSGQIALWMFFYNNYTNYLTAPLNTFVYHVSFVSLTIFFASIIKNLYIKTENG